MSFKPHNTKREGLQGSGLSKETQALLDGMAMMASVQSTPQAANQISHVPSVPSFHLLEGRTCSFQHPCRGLQEAWAKSARNRGCGACNPRKPAPIKLASALWAGGDNGWVDTLQTGAVSQLNTSTPLPASFNFLASTGTAAFHSPASTHRTTVKVPKVGQATRKPMPGPPASFSGKRMQNAMPANEREQFIGGRPAPDRAIEKDRLAQ
eukprot:1160845-Pelagomonas_calceolata.AAC.2